MEFKIGDVLLDKYRVTKVIKSGGFGVVYICEYLPKTSVRFAVKSFKDEYFEREEVIKNFYHEAEVWVKLGYHGNIVRAFWVSELAGKPHIFLEYVDGNLRDWIRDKRTTVLSANTFAYHCYLFVEQFCDGMIYANNKDLGEGKKGIVHRDIKPENIMLYKDAILKITDFGLVKALGRPTAENPTGTPEYMSPEQFRTMDVDQRSDIYSFGVVLYEILFGRRPFPEPEDPKIRWEHYRRCHSDMLPSFPTPTKSTAPGLSFLQRWLGIISRCLRKNPKERCQTFEELNNEFKEIRRDHLGIEEWPWKREAERLFREAEGEER